MKVKTAIYLGLLALVVAIGFFTTGCGEQEKALELSPPGVETILVEDIIVEKIEVETIEDNIKTFENSTTYWD